MIDARPIVALAAVPLACLVDNPDYIPPPSEASEAASDAASEATTAPATATTGVSATTEGSGSSRTTDAASEPTAATSPSGGETTGACVDGEITCEGDDAAVCEGGAWVAKVCDGACTEGVGCTPCAEGELRCEGDLVLVCEGGVFLLADLCDPLQGLACDPQAGCVGACSFESLVALDRLDLGCDFFALTTPSSVIGGSLLAVVEAGPEAATVTWSQGDEILGSKVIAANTAAALPSFGWEPMLGELTPATATGAKVPVAARRIRSDRPVRVTQYSGVLTDASAGATALLPTTSWDLAASVAHWGGDALKDVPWVVITPLWDQTAVQLQLPPQLTIRPGSGFDEYGGGEVVVDEGDALLVLADYGYDLSGALVTADGPIQVLAGNHCASLEGGTNCDHIEESMPGIAAAGTLFAVPPALSESLMPRPYLVRVIGTQDGTTVKVDPENKTFLIGAGQVVDVKPLAPVVVWASGPVLVYEYVWGAPGGLEALTWVTPVGKWADRATAQVPASLAGESAALIVYDKGAAPTINGKGLIPLGPVGSGVYGQYEWAIAQLFDVWSAIEGGGAFSASLASTRSASGLWSNLGARF